LLIGNGAFAYANSAFSGGKTGDMKAGAGFATVSKEKGYGDKS
jgi:hypothetical protein